jgi:hydroxymethylglutaryl-CoA synthase
VDKNLEKELVRLSEKLFKTKTAPSLLFAKEIGNMYTPSLYSCLVSYLLSKPLEELIDSRVCLFSYGSGSAAAMFSLVINNNKSDSQRFNLTQIISTLQQRREHMLESRVEIEPSLYDAYLRHREVNNKKVPREADSDVSAKSLLPGTWFLKSIDASYRRQYERTPLLIDSDTNSAFDHKRAKEVLVDELARFL